MNSILKANSVRQIISISFALVVGLIVEYFFSMAHDYIIPVTAVFVMLTSVGNPVFQGLKRFVLIALLIIALSLILPPHHMLYSRIYDACLGAIIGIASNLCILPRKADSEFRAALIPILSAYQSYFSAIIDSIFEKDEHTLEIKKINIELKLQQIPAWVYESGFDLGLQKGHQYFLMKVQQIAGILFAMHHSARCQFDEEVRTVMREPTYICAEKIKIFFSALITVFELRKIKEGVEDFEQQLHELDVKFQSLVPETPELLDMSREDVSFYAIIYALNDLRKALIKLGQALR
jgi:hypothetical protein